MEPNIPLNVLSNREPDTLSQVAAMINNSGYNRSQRRRLEKALCKTQKLSDRAMQKLDRSAYKEYRDAVDQNFIHFFAALALVCYEDYRWKEDDSHDQITSMLERVGNKIDKYAHQGYTTEDLAKLVEDEIGIVLVPDKH